ncbi:MAG: pentapeptide repeat-containing protein [Myxococcota bacterium]|nr:pentapeptide repeat-containing protein [Myxococcota bacterium]
MSLLELLQAGKIEEFNNTRGVHNAPDLFAADLSGLDLRGADLNGANLEKADLCETDLRGVNLARARLDGADMTECKLQKAVLVQARLRGAYIDEADLDGADFSGANLSEAVLTKSDGPGAVFDRAKLRQAELKECKLTGARFLEAKLENADFSGSYLENADFTEATLTGAAMENCSLENARFTQARAANVSFTRSKLTGADLSKADLTAAALDHAQVAGASFREADLTEATHEGCRLEDADLHGARTDAGVEVPEEQVRELPDAPLQIVVEDLRGAVNSGKVALLWENEEDANTLANRMVVMGEGEAFEGEAPALGAPAEFSLAREVVDLGEGFAAVVLLERTTGVELHVTWVGADGARVGQSMPLGFEPAVRPMFLGGERLRIVGIGRRGPSLHILDVDPEQGIVPVLTLKVTTARGLLGGLQPVLLTRGGAIHQISDSGLGAPYQAPADFGLRGASAACHGDELLLSWLPRGKKGLTFAHLHPGERPEERVAMRKDVVLAVDLAFVEGEPRAFVLREDPDRGGACGVWAQDLAQPHLPPTEVFNVADHDIETLRIIGIKGDAVTLLATTLTEQILVLRVEGEGKAEVLSTL